jgi:tousled-like kinase
MPHAFEEEDGHLVASITPSQSHIHVQLSTNSANTSTGLSQHHQQQQPSQQQLHPQGFGSHSSILNNTSGSSSNSSHRLTHQDSNSSDLEPLSSREQQNPSSTQKLGSKRRRFSPDEDSKILQGVAKFYDEKKKVVDWDKVQKWSDLDRTKEQIKNRYSRIKPKGHIPALASPLNEVNDISSPHHFSDLESHDSNVEEPSLKRQKTIHEYVTVPNSSSKIQAINPKSNQEPIKTEATSHSIQPTLNTNGGSSSNTNTIYNDNMDADRQQFQQQKQKYEDIIQQLRKQLDEKDQKLLSFEKKLKENEQKIRDLAQEHQTSENAKIEKYCNSLIEILTKLAEKERKEDKDRMNENSIKIGTITYQKTIGEAFEVWQDGESFIDLERRQSFINAEKERLEKMKKQIQKQKMNIKKTEQHQQPSSSALMPAPALPGTSSINISSSNSNNSLIAQIQNDMMLNDLNEQEEIVRIRLSQIKKDELALLVEREKLLIAKSMQVREIKRIRDQERSRFSNPTLIQKRYFLMKLLGRGGFSEVYKAYDLYECRVVACKIHQINPNWKEHRKENYIKHVLRECQIHKSVKHPRLIQMFDTFILDNNTFVTVLEYCEGYDLDLYIKKHQKIPEKEAKCIISQVFSGLAYLNMQKNKIIHFDLKPANILFSDGQIKITDFGLSKIMEEEESIELTSQGAGTYWYLPPECFDVGGTPKISPKVDVWSAGVVFYQMLFGKKPFGNDLSQQKILSEQTIINAKNIVFPQKPVVSEECKEFIRKCLTYDPAERPDVLAMYNDKYLRSTKTK